jgi:ribosomal protein L7/L12
MSGGSDVQWESLKPVLRLINDRLDHMEQFLVASAQRNGPAYSPFAGFQPPGADVIELARSGKTLEAIKAYREQTGAGLEDARTAVLAI